MDRFLLYIGGGFALVALIFWLDEFRQSRRLNKQSPLRVKPCPDPYPLGFGLLYKFVKSSLASDDLECWRELFRSADNYTTGSKVINQRVVFTAEPENVKAILATQFKDYGKGKDFHRDFLPFLGNSIFSTDHTQWSESRQLIRPQFVKSRVSDLQVFERHAQQLIQKIDEAKGATIDIDSLFFRYTLDAATDFLLGTSVNSLDNPEDTFALAFAEVQRVQSIIARVGPFAPYIPRKSYLKGCKVIDEFVKPYVEESLRLSPADLAKTEKEDHYTFLHALAGYTRDPKMLRDQLVAVLLAGRDTTAGSLSWTFHELSRHPEVLEKLREEILKVVGPDREPTYEHLKELKYLQHTINEILRLYPAVPFNVRRALHDTTLPTGGGPDGKQPIAILADTPMAYSTLVMQRRPDLYPAEGTDGKPLPSPEVFCPDRWDVWQPKHWQYIPFNGGPRICIGQQFALTEMGYTLVRLLQKYSVVEKRWEDSKQFMRSDLVLRPGTEVLVSVR